jgi:hypothetical protein
MYIICAYSPLRIHQAGTGGSEVPLIASACHLAEAAGHTPGGTALVGDSAASTSRLDRYIVHADARHSTADPCRLQPQTSATRDDDSVLIAEMVRTSCVFVSAESHLRGVIAYRLAERAHERHSKPLWHQAG